MPATLHTISHTHWDREWYLPFEQHRLRLVDLIDMLLDIFDSDPAFKHFHMDGQMIPLQDYLVVRPQNREAVARAAREGKLSLGPWYVLQDEFLTSGEANVRNMMLGLKLARGFGEPMMVGYIPDAFGNISQMPQILRGFGIDSAVFGRGLNQYNPQKAEDPDAEPGEIGYKSELTWRSPDGSEVLGVFMANWYSNAMDIPPDPEEAAAFLSQARDNALRFATTSQLLMMNGCDHTPTRPDVGRVIQSVRELMPDEIIHTDLASYIEALKGKLGELQIVEGELRSEYTGGWTTLADTLSARMYEKQANHQCQQLLERWVEPLCAVASQLGERHPTDQVWHAWAKLMENHPHDSICGCSADVVHREVDMRFEQARHVGEALRDRAAQAIGDRVDNSLAQDEAATVLVFNPLPGVRTEIVKLQLQFPEGDEVGGIAAFDDRGDRLPAVGEPSEEPGWDYKLPDDRFRTDHGTRRVDCAIAVPDVPGMGYKTITVKPVSVASESREAERSAVLENEFLRVDIHDFGILDITDKTSGVSFEGIGVLEDGGDCGNEYIYRAPERDRVIRTDDPDSFMPLSELPSFVSDDISPEDIGSGSEAPVVYEREPGDLAVTDAFLVVPRWSDAWSRDESSLGLMLSIELSLGRAARHLQVTVHIHNTATDHRIRALFPTDIDADHCYADGQFDILKRKIEPWRGWENPSNPQPQQAFVDISDGERGLCIANRGLPCYEVLRDGRNTIALTLLRCVGEIGDWGQFPTPEAQCIGPAVAEYAIIPHAGHIMDPENCEAARIAREYATPMWATQVKHFAHPHKERWSNQLPTQASFISVEPNWLVLSAIKKAEDRDSMIVRLYNPFEADAEARIGCLWDITEAHLVSLSEEREGNLEAREGGVCVAVPAKRIVTVEVVTRSGGS